MIKRPLIGLVSISLSMCLAEYAEADAAAGKAKSEVCAGCHGEDGNASAPIFPKLAGQHDNYLARQLKEFKSKKRIEPTMNAMAEALSEEDIADISAYFAKQKIKPEKAESTPVGEKVFRAGNTATGVPACTACHGPNGGGNPYSGYPALGGQYSAYLSKTLHDYKTGERANDPSEIMKTIASRMSEEEINAVSDYASGLQ